MKNVLFIDKPAGMTSFDVCFRLRKIFGTKKIGHTGTLDPAATGVMIVLLDKATKANQFLVSARKVYTAEVVLGLETDTLDCDGKLLRKEKITPFTVDELRDVLTSFLGKSMQVPPLTSAIKVAGKKLYEYQRQGKAVAIPSREIEVFSCELLGCTEEGFTVRVEVSSGTYIRSLARDIAKKLNNNLGVLKSLRRAAIDKIDVAECDALSDDKGSYRPHALTEILSMYYPTVEINDPEDVLNGKRIYLPRSEQELFLKKGDHALAIYRLAEDGYYYCVRGLF